MENATSVREPGASVEGFLSAFFRMVEVGVHEDGMILLQHIRKALRDSLGERHQVSRSNSENLDMLHSPQSRQNIFQAIIGVG